MKECCDSKNTDKELFPQCRECGNIGKQVKDITLKHLLREDKIPFIKNIPYFFCSTPNCNVVYFSKDGDAFYKTDIKVRVGIKETEEPIPVCYCFGITKKMILDDIAQYGHSAIEEKIRQEIKKDNCSCQITNPGGVCCLGNVAKIIKGVTTTKKEEQMAQYYICPTCNQKVERDLMKYIHHTELHIINLIKKKHPNWDCSEGLCPKCLECFHKAMRGECKT